MALISSTPFPSPPRPDRASTRPAAVTAKLAPPVATRDKATTPAAPAAGAECSREAVHSTLVARYQAGGTLEEVAEAGFSTSFVCQALKEAGVERRRGDRLPSGIRNERLLSLLTVGVPDDVLTRAVSQYQGGGTIADAAAVLGRSREKTRAILAASGVRLRHGGARRRPGQVSGSQRDALRAEAAALRRAGASRREIARTLGRSDHLIRMLLDEAGVVQRPSGTPRTWSGRTEHERLTLQARAVALHRDGATLCNIARALHSTEPTIAALLDEAGVTRRRLVRIPRRRRKRLCAVAATRYQAGDSVRVITVSLGYSYTTIRNLLMEEGVPLRAPRQPTANSRRAMTSTQPQRCGSETPMRARTRHHWASGSSAVHDTATNTSHAATDAVGGEPVYDREPDRSALPPERIERHVRCNEDPDAPRLAEGRPFQTMKRSCLPDAARRHPPPRGRTAIAGGPPSGVPFVRGFAATGLGL